MKQTCLEYNTNTDVPNPPSKVTPSHQVKVRSVISAVKKAPAKEPIEILQDLPSTSKQTNICDTAQKKRLKHKV